MAKLSSYRRIYKTDYEKPYQGLVDSMSLTINQSFDEVYQALNHNITFTDNIQATIATITVSVDASGTPLTNTSFKLANGQTVAQGLIAINAVCANNVNILPDSGIFLAFTNSTGTINISNIKGLSKDNRWIITILAI